MNASFRLLCHSRPSGWQEIAIGDCRRLGRKENQWLVEVLAQTLLFAPLFLSASPVCGQPRFWVADGVGNWLVGTNWNAGVPTFTNDAEINNGGTATIFDNFAEARNLYLASSPGNIGTLDVVGGTLILPSGINPSSLFVGQNGTGTIKIRNSGRVRNEYSVIGGVNSNARGTATVDGAGSEWSSSFYLAVGYAGTGTLSITDGGHVANTGASIGETFGSMGTVTVDGRMSKWTGGNLNVGNVGTGTLSVTEGMVLTANGSVGNYVGSDGTVTLNGAHAIWTNSGDLAVGNGGTGRLNLNGGTVENFNGNIGLGAGSTGTVVVDGMDSTWTNNSVLAVGVLGAGSLSITGGGAVTSTNGRIGREAGSTGDVLIDGPASIWNCSGLFTMGIFGTGMSTLTVQNSGDLTVASGMTIGRLGTVRGDGTIYANIQNTAGVIAPSSPDSSLGRLYIDGNYTQSFGGMVQIELASPTDFDRLSINGTMTLPSGSIAGSGTLAVSLVDDYVPQGSLSFDILDWVNRVGTFDSVLLPTLDGTLTWDTSQLYTTGVLSVMGPAGLPGDYNEDGIVNAADYVVWRNNMGSPTSLANDNTPGVGQDDYDRWVDNFGQSLTNPSSASATASAGVAVPEASSVLLLVLAAPLLSVRGRRLDSFHTACRGQE